jgi:uncharacterized protein YigE (DUF2233 family)
MEEAGAMGPPESSRPRGQPFLRSVLLLLIVMQCVIARPQAWADDLRWDRLAEGLSIAVWNPEARCRNEVERLTLIKIDPDRFRFSVYFYLDEKLDQPVPIDEWLRRSRATVIFNAGLFQPDYSYLGILLKGGRRLGGQRHQRWRGLFVAEPTTTSERKARVLDLALDQFAEAHPPFLEAAQSLMLFDRSGTPRVRKSERRAQQTIVAEDREGRIVVIKTSEASSLWELARCLAEGRPELSHAMAMDGGSSSDVAVSPAAAGEWAGAPVPPPWYGVVDIGDRPHIPLPAVIGILPRE